MSAITFNVIRGKDFRLANNITELQLAYVLTIAYANRVVQCSMQFGCSFPLHASRLKQVAAGIQLPHVLATYIESIGKFALVTGANVVPYAGDYRTLFPLNSALMIDPATLIAEAGREPVDEPWSIDTEWIIAYNNATTRASRSGIRFRTVDNTAYDGRVEMCVSYRVEQGMFLPVAPQLTTTAEIQLGAAYAFRDYNQIVDWPGVNKELLYDSFTAVPFDQSVLFSDVCVAAFAGNQTSTD